MVRPKKSAPRGVDHARIKSVAWQHIADNGVPGLTLRAVARDLGISTPSLYHYYADRDALLEDLAADAFQSLTEALKQARDAVPPSYIAGIIRSLGLAYRTWARQFPNHYDFIMSQTLTSPLRGGVQPRQAAAQALAVLVGVLQQMLESGRLNPAALPPVTLPPPGYYDWMQTAGTFDYRAFVAAHAIWATMHGLVDSEMVIQFRGIGDDYAVIYEHAIDRLINEYLLPL